ncbi:Ribonuclease H [Colletotrichum fructicola]|nr:Ribonuclease H [Colletotrichum fructicola]KAF4920650.1 Ribonuclease H [Colletotrichum fructicola]KAF5482869.1 Ribonuclease H [Colletotrichum fructicola]
MPTSQDERAESEGWHGPLQIRDRGSSSTDPESLILAEVGRLMAEYTRDIETNVRPTSTRRKAYYVVWKGRKRGVFTSWPQCMAQTSGFSGARFEGTRTFQEAADKLRDELTKDVRLQASRGHLSLTAETSNVPRAIASPALHHGKTPNPDSPAIGPSHPQSSFALDIIAADGPTVDRQDRHEAARAHG